MGTITISVGSKNSADIRITVVERPMHGAPHGAEGTKIVPE
jgi:hypothetical protein